MTAEIERRLTKALSDRYRVIRKVGSGAMGSVFLADDLKLGRSVAVKVLHPELGASVEAARFLREIRIAAALAHPHIVPVHDAGEAEGLLFFVMRFQEGESLQALLDRSGPPPLARAVSIASDVAKGLAHAHSHGVIHRDIKPANILLTGDHAVIADFGIARAVEVATTHGPAPVMTATAIGTPLYMSPEQATTSPEVDGRSDVYSLGCVLYEMLTGEPPFRSASAAVVLASHIHKEVPPVRLTRPDVPPGLAAVVDRALAKSPDERFQSATDLGHALESARTALTSSGLGLRSQWEWLPSRTRKRVMTGITLVLVALTVLLGGIFWPPGSAPYDPSLMVVLPFRDATTTVNEEELLLGLARELTRQFNQWESVSAVPEIAQSGARFDLGIEDLTLARIDEGLAVARALGAGTLVNLSARVRSDSVLVSADLVDVQTGRTRGKPHEAWGLVRDPFPMAADLAHSVLGLEGEASEIARLHRQSAIPEALIEYESGRTAFEQWRLTEAESSFRRVVGLDPAFAMARYSLALTLFWQWMDGVSDPEVVGPTIALESTDAVRNSLGLPLRDSLHVDAFHKLQAGDYDGARDVYRALLDRDSTDVYAWLLQGSVEYLDPWLRELPSGELRPRGSLALARRSFVETVRLSPGLQGAYGQVFDIADRVARAAELGSAPPFQEPRGEFLAPWATPSLRQARPYWPAYSDSLMWLDEETWVALGEDEKSSGANRLLEESLGLLRRWAAFEPNLARPQRELAHWARSLRSRTRGPRPPNQIDSLTREVFQHASRALALAVDTTRNELLQLANLRLALGNVRDARSAWRFAMEWDEPEGLEGLSSAASNVLLYSGRPAEALEYLAFERSRTRIPRDPASGELVDDGGAEPLLQRLQILGATGASGPPLEGTFRELTDLWSVSDDRPDEEVDFLRTFNAPRIAVALWLAPAVLESWVGELKFQDPLWAALRPDAPDRKGLLGAAMEAERKEWEVEDPSRSYLLGAVAQEVGDDTLAVRLFSRLDSLVYRVESRDPGWGLVPLSYLCRGRAFEAMGDPESAAQFYRRFAEAWSEPDLPASLAQEVRRILDAFSR